MTDKDQTIGLLVMAYGTATGAEDVERYYTDIRGGHAPSARHLEDLKARYAAIGNRFPLLEMTRAQSEGLAAELNAAGSGPRFRAYLGMKHSAPFIPEGVARMREDGIDRAVGIVMAPHWSGMSVETYIERVEKAVADEGGPAFTFVHHWHDHPEFVDLLASRVSAALARLTPEGRLRATVVFSAHSLPTRTVEDGSRRCLRCDRCPQGCRYAAQLRETADLVAERVGMEGSAYTTAWQSVGRTAGPWWGPAVDEVIPALAAAGRSAVVVCSCGFAADHLETLYDLDIEARGVAERAGIEFVRAEMPNDDPAFIRVLASVVRDHLAPEGG